MLKLNLVSEPYWLDLGHGVRLLVEPLTTAVMIAARNDPAVAEAADNGASQDDLARLVAKSIARITVRDWEGVGDADGQPLPLTPEGLDALLELWPLFEAFQTGYVAGALILEQEKNGSAPLPSGSSAGAETTAAPAKGRARTARAGGTHPRP